MARGQQAAASQASTAARLNTYGKKAAPQVVLKTTAAWQHRYRAGKDQTKTELGISMFPMPFGAYGQRCQSIQAVFVVRQIFHVYALQLADFVPRSHLQIWHS